MHMHMPMHMHMQILAIVDIDELTDDLAWRLSILTRADTDVIQFVCISQYV